MLAFTVNGTILILGEQAGRPKQERKKLCK